MTLIVRDSRKVTPDFRNEGLPIALSVPPWAFFEFARLGVSHDPG